MSSLWMLRAYCLWEEGAKEPRMLMAGWAAPLRDTGQHCPLPLLPLLTRECDISPKSTVLLCSRANQCSPCLNLWGPKQGTEAFYWGVRQENWYPMLPVQFSLCCLCEDAEAVI